MKINFTLGIDPVTKIEDLIENNISNVFCGYFTKENIKKWPPEFSTLNRRSKYGSFCGKESFSRFAREAERNNISINVTFNSLYTYEQYDDILENINFVSKFNSVVGIIISDIGLLIRLKKIKYSKKIIISTALTTFNSSTVNFYKHFGAKEFVLDRQLKIEEIISIIKKHSDINFEIFLLFSNCLFVDGFCSLMHCIERTENNQRYNLKGNIINCELIRQSQEQNNFIVLKKNLNSRINYGLSFKYHNMQFGCNLCTVNMLKNFQNVVFKIVSRNIYSIVYLKIFSLIKEIEERNSIKPKELYKYIFGTECNETGCYISKRFS